MNIAAAVLLKGEPAQLTDVPFIAFVEKTNCRLFLDHIAKCASGTKKICTRLALSSATRAIGLVELQSTSSVDTFTRQLWCRTAIIMLSSGKSTAANNVLSNQYATQDWFELFPDAAMLEIGGRIISANPGAVRFLGAKSSGEIEGRDIIGIIHPDSRRSFSNRMFSLPKGRLEAKGGEEKFIKLDGGEIEAHVFLKSVDFDGVFATLVVARDVSKEREMEESLVRAQDLSAQILANNSIPTAIISVETGRFIETNEIFCQLAARSREQIIGQSVSAIQLVGPAGDQSNLLSLSSQTDSRECEARLIRPDGSVLEVLVSAKAIASSRAPCLLLMIQDLTDLRRLRNDIVEISDEEQRRFSRDLHDSHCQDLTAIAFYAETIAAGVASRDEEAAAQIRTLVEMVQRSVENVHALAAGLDSQQVQNTGLALALEELASRVGRRFGLTCTADVDRRIENHTAQAVHLYRIAQEAMSNAARHARAHSIKVELRLSGDTGILRIADDGVGFATDNDEDGLGLRTMEYRASVIKGTLKVDSKPGSGTVVVCSFPISVGAGRWAKRGKNLVSPRVLPPSD
jgi:PAS domain S-box-containing protein